MRSYIFSYDKPTLENHVLDSKVNGWGHLLRNGLCDEDKFNTFDQYNINYLNNALNLDGLM